MRKIIASLILAVLLLCSPKLMRAQTPTSLTQSVYSSVTLLYAQDDAGGMQMLCTTTAYAKSGDNYRLVSASHCVEGTTEEEQKAAKYFVTADSAGSKNFIPVKLIQAGDKDKGDDFSIFETEQPAVMTITPLGDSSKLELGQRVIDIAAPLGLGKQYFEGYVSNIHLDRPPLDAGDVKWKDVMLVSIGGGPGSSGSAVVSVDQKAIVGFLVGDFNEGQLGFIVLPVNNFKAFEKLVDSGKYHKKVDPKSFLDLFDF